MKTTPERHKICAEAARDAAENLEAGASNPALHRMGAHPLRGACAPGAAITGVSRGGRRACCRRPRRARLDRLATGSRHLAASVSV
jgi:hypothetical protein